MSPVMSLLRVVVVAEKEQDIPIIENRPLVRALAERVRAIPVDLYAAVAELLATVYRFKKRGLRA
jgi:flagellar biosynthesis protein FlhB